MIRPPARFARAEQVVGAAAADRRVLGVAADVVAPVPAALALDRARGVTATAERIASASFTAEVMVTKRRSSPSAASRAWSAAGAVMVRLACSEEPTWPPARHRPLPVPFVQPPLHRAPGGSAQNSSFSAAARFQPTTGRRTTRIGERRTHRPSGSRAQASVGRSSWNGAIQRTMAWAIDRGRSGGAPPGWGLGGVLAVPDDIQRGTRPGSSGAELRISLAFPHRRNLYSSNKRPRSRLEL